MPAKIPLAGHHVGGTVLGALDTGATSSSPRLDTGICDCFAPHRFLQIPPKDWPHLCHDNAVSMPIKAEATGATVRQVDGSQRLSHTEEISDMPMACVLEHIFCMCCGRLDVHAFLHAVAALAPNYKTWRSIYIIPWRLCRGIVWGSKHVPAGRCKSEYLKIHEFYNEVSAGVPRM